MRSLTSVLGNGQRLDGGAMFGNVPRALWSRWIAPDAAHRIPLACRCLLLRDGDRRILFETGIGAFFPPHLRDRYGVTSPRHDLVDHLAALGLAPGDIDVVVLSHLHFDHAGGLLPAHGDGPPRLLFDRAAIVVGAAAWARAQAPHPRDRASFLPDLNALLAESGRLVVLEDDHWDGLEGVRFHRSDGHTPGMLLAEIAMPDGPVVFAADLVPGVPWVHAPVTMGYDRFPERVIDEKIALLTDLESRGGRLFFTHDPEVALARIARDDRGRFQAVDPVPALDALTT